MHDYEACRIDAMIDMGVMGMERRTVHPGFEHDRAHGSTKRKTGGREPFCHTVVDDPWQRPHDVEEINRKAYEAVSGQLGNLENSKNRQSLGVLILGEAGSGKTHILSRVSRRLTPRHPLMYVRRIAHEDKVAQCIWKSMIESLLRPVPAGHSFASNGLEDLLVHVFADAIDSDLAQGIETGEPRIREKAQHFRSNPQDLLGVLKNPRKESVIWSILSNRLQRRYPELDMELIRALFLYACVAKGDDRRELTLWMKDQEVDENTLHRLELKPRLDDSLLMSRFPERVRESLAKDPPRG